MFGNVDAISSFALYFIVDQPLGKIVDFANMDLIINLHSFSRDIHR